MPAATWTQRRAELHLQGTLFDHDQSSHGRRGGAPPPGVPKDAVRAYDLNSDRNIWERPDQEQMFVTAADGTVIGAVGHRHQPANHSELEPGRWEVIRQRTADMLNGVTDGYDLAPSSTTPVVIVTSDPSVQAPAFVNPSGYRYPSHATVLNDHEGPARLHWDFLYGEDVGMTAAQEAAAWAQMETTFMPVMFARDIPFGRYTGAHEYGHVRAAVGDDDRSIFQDIMPMTLGQNSGDERTWGVWGYMSRYATTNSVEAHAEAFAEWALSEGQTTNRFALAYADIFGWGEEELAIAASAPKIIAVGPEPLDNWDTIILGDTPTGPVYVYTSDADFHLQGQHDQQTHGNRESRLGPKVLNDNPDRFEPPASWSLMGDVDDAVTAMLDTLNAERDDGVTFEFAGYKYRPLAEFAAELGTIHVGIKGPDGDGIGVVHREFIFRDDGTPKDMYAAHLYIDPEFQGQGIGTHIQEAFEDFAAASGFDHAQVDAANVGRYTWARAGYDFVNDAGQMDSFARWTREQGHADLADRFEQAAEQMRRQSVREPVPDITPTPWEVADVVGPDAWAHGGWEAPSWTGRKRLRTAITASGGFDRQVRLERVRSAYDEWWPRFPAAAEGADDPDAEAAWRRLIGDSDVDFHLRGQHDQSTHGNWATPTLTTAAEAADRLTQGKKTTTSPDDAVDALVHIGQADQGVVDLTNLSIDGHPYLFGGVLEDGRRDRGDMPQIPAYQIDNFRTHLESRGVHFTPEIVDPADVKSTQRQLDATTVGQMIRKVQEGKYTTGHPPWVSSDDHILDGHHRWATLAVLSTAGRARPPMNVLRVDMPINDLLAFADEFNDLYNVPSKAHGELAADTLVFGYPISFHLQGQHDQQTHGNRGTGTTPGPAATTREPPIRNFTAFNPHPAAGLESPRQLWRRIGRGTSHLAVETDNGEVIRLDKADTARTPLRDQIDMINALADAYENEPTVDPPVIRIVDPYQFKMDHNATLAYVTARPGWFSDEEPNEIYVNENPDLWGEHTLEQFRAAAMPVAQTMTTRAEKLRYVMFHEYGHVRMGLGNDPIDTIEAAAVGAEREGLMPFTSTRGRASEYEVHAEAFAEWALSGGQTENEIAQWYADRFGWDTDDDIGMVASGPGRRPVVLGDNADGPVYIYDDEPDSDADFHLQGQHDQKSHGNRGGTSHSTDAEALAAFQAHLAEVMPPEPPPAETLAPRYTEFRKNLESLRRPFTRPKLTLVREPGTMGRWEEVPGETVTEMRNPEYAAWHGYTGDLYYPINAFARTGERVQGYPSGMQREVDALTAAFQFATPSPDVVLRGKTVTAGEDEWAEMGFRPGDEYVDQGFMSTTSRPSTGVRFGLYPAWEPDTPIDKTPDYVTANSVGSPNDRGLVMTIRTHGAPSIPGKSREGESIFPIGTRYRVLSATDFRSEQGAWYRHLDVEIVT